MSTNNTAQGTPGSRYSFGDLISRLGHGEDGRPERTSVCWLGSDRGFLTRFHEPGEAQDAAMALNADESILLHTWFGVNPIDAGVTSGRGKAKDVTRLAALFADLDVKPGSFPDLDTAREVIDELAEMLGQRPFAVIHSGHGLQPLWLVDRDSARDLDNEESQRLLKRFGRMVVDVAQARGYAVDQVFDLARILRVPDTRNVKDPEHPVPTSCEPDTGEALIVEGIVRALDEWGVPTHEQLKTRKQCSAMPMGEVLSWPVEWRWGGCTCNYVTEMVVPWDQDSDRPSAGRHQWALKRAVRLACAVRLGCITEDGFEAAVEYLEKALSHWCATVGVPRDVQPDEVAGAYRWAEAKVATFTDEQVRAELGDHVHARDEVSAADRAGSFDDDVDEELHRLRVREEARKQLAAEKLGPPGGFDMGLLREILARPQQEPFRIRDLVPADGGTLIVAQRKTGKTTFLLNLARSLITGEDFLGKFTTFPITGRVGVLNYEVSSAQLARWAREAGIPIDRMFLVNLRGGGQDPLGHAENRRILAAELRTQEVKALIVDPFGRAFSGHDQNNSGEVGAWLADLDTFARTEVGCRDVFLAAHAGWNGDHVRGASALEDWADSIVFMTNGTGDNVDDRFLRATGRDVHVDEDRLAFDPHTRRLTVTGTGSRTEASTRSRIEVLVGRVVEHVVMNPGASFGQIKVAVTGREADIRSAIREADSRGLLRREVGATGTPHKHYPVRPGTAGSDPSGADGVEK